MKFGLVPVNVGVGNIENMVGFAQQAESLGVESLWTFEHVIVPEEYESKYPYSPTGKMGAAPDVNFVDPLIALAAIAAHTKTVKLATGVNILPQANPLLLAKQAASLDFVSGGRFMLGVGIGWLREEFDAMGVPFERRGARFDEYVEAMQAVWKGDTVDFDGEFVHWKNFRSYPIPKNLPIVIGGTKGKAFQRIARFGDGWFAPSGSVDELKGLIGELRAACQEAGRNVDEIEITSMWMGPASGTDAIAQFADLGVARLVVPLPALGANPVEGMEKLGEVIAAQSTRAPQNN